MADYQGLTTYQELDPAKKTVEWADNVITQFRRDWTRLYNLQDATRNRSYLLSTFDIRRRMERLFSDEDFKKHVNFIPIATFEKIKNILISEITKFPPKVRLKATDPTSTAMKDRDLMILKNRSIIEGDLSRAQVAVGGPPYKIPASSYNSNIDKFDEMGLNESDDDDLGIYKEVWHKLLFEIEGQNLLNAVLKTNKFEEFIKLFVIDILAVKAICYQAYVSQLTGEIKFKHLFPEVCRGIMGDRPDSADAVCLGWEDTVTIRDFLDYVGNEFDFNRDWRQLLYALNYANGQKYTGFTRGGQTFDLDIWGDRGNTHDGGEGGIGSGFDRDRRVEWTMAFNYKIYMGYIEWKSFDGVSFKINEPKNLMFPVPYAWIPNEKVTEYQKKSWYNETTYKSTYIATGTVDQFLYGFGKLYHQTVEGQYDEYSNYSLCFYREEGLSAVEAGMPEIDLACDAFYKMYWAVSKAKPDSDTYWVSELVKVSKAFDKINGNSSQNPAAGNMLNSLEAIIKFEKEKQIRIRDYPSPDGKTILQPPPTNDKQHNGLDPIAIAMQTVVDYAEKRIMAKVGINELREGMSPDPKDGYKINAQASIYSRNATGYVDRLLAYTVQNTVNIATQLTQDIIRFKDSQPYKWLLNLLGSATVKAIQQLDLFSAHRKGIFVTTYNSEIERQKIEMLTQRAQDNKEITAEQAFIVGSIEDYEKAGYVLAYLKKKEQKRQQRIIEQQQQFQAQMQDRQHQNVMEQIKTKLQGEFGIEKLKSDTAKYVADRSYAAKVDVKEITVNAEGPKQEDKAAGQIQLETHKQNLKEQAPYGSPQAA